MSEPILWYLADPMCSWCWGFTPTIETLRDEFRDRARIALVLGGLRPGETTPMTASARDDILHHWHAVHERTGQPFRFDAAPPEGFVYDTEPACRAVVTVGGLDPTLIFAMFKAIQSGFYAEGRDVTQSSTLADLAAGLGVGRDLFLHTFNSDIARHRTQAHFKQARQAGITGFPSLILQEGEQLHPISNGCLPLQTIRDAINSHLSA